MGLSWFTKMTCGLALLATFAWGAAQPRLSPPVHAADIANAGVDGAHHTVARNPLLIFFGELIVSCLTSETCTDTVKETFGGGQDGTTVPLSQVQFSKCRINTGLDAFKLGTPFVNFRKEPCDNTPVITKLVTGDIVNVRFHPETRTQACGYRYQRAVWVNPKGIKVVGWLNPGALECGKPGEVW